MPELDAPQPRPKRLVVVMDGTWNSPAKPSQRDDGDEVFKPSNPLKTCRAIKDLDDVAATLVVHGRPRDGDTVTVGGKVYTFRDELDDVDGHVQIGKGARKSLENLRYAINTRRHRGRYADSTTRHPAVTARKVTGDLRRVEMIPRPGAGDAPWSNATSVPGWRWVASTAMVDTLRQRGLDPAHGIPQIVYYDVGVGALRSTPGLSNKIHRLIDQAFGGARGAGFEANIEDGYLFLSLNYRPGDEIFLFGFSRGAASVRGLARFVDWMGGLVPPEHSYWIPRYFDAFLAGSTVDATRAAIVAHHKQRALDDGRPDDEAARSAEEIAGHVAPATIRFLGVWDSVLSIGASREKPHVADSPPKLVEHARQALAIDERRPDFLPRIWTRCSPENPEQTLEQRWFAGAHSNIGGGYVHDGLANVALRWMLDEARDAGLCLDNDMLRYYREYPEDRLYDSSSWFWRLIQTVTFRRHLGVRDIRFDEDAGLAVHPSVFRRLAAQRVSDDGREHEHLEPYRPRNLCRCLARVRDLDGLIADMDLGDDFELPTEVKALIAAER